MAEHAKAAKASPDRTIFPLPANSLRSALTPLSAPSRVEQFQPVNAYNVLALFFARAAICPAVKLEGSNDPD
jgi:hypothetical protein